MKNTTLFLFLLLRVVSYSQPGLVWAKQIGDTNPDYGYAITADENGNIYTTGTFNGTVDFDPGAGVYNLIATSTNIFVCKLDAGGNFAWARIISGNSMSDIAVNSSGVYVLGRGSFFLNKFDLSGNLLWTKNISASGISLALDANGNIFITGGFPGTVDFDPGLGVYNLICQGDCDAFILKLDPSGNFIWVKQIGGPDDVWGSSGDLATSIALDVNGNIFISGGFYVTVDFDPGPGIYNLTSIEWADMFILKLDLLGDFIWVKQIGGPSYQYGGYIAVDTSNNVLITSRFGGTIDFDPGTGIYNLTATVTGYADIFICKLNGSGNFIWAKSIGGIGWDESSSIAVDKIGNVYTTGEFESTADFDPGTGTYNLTSSGYRDVFISELDSNGNFVCAGSMGAAGGDKGYSIFVDNNSNVFSTGSFGGTVDFDMGGATYNLTATGYADVFISKFQGCSTTVGETEIAEDNSALIIYPNPTSGIFQINYSSTEKSKLQLNIFNSFGEKIYSEIISQPVNECKKDIDLSKYAKGIYFIEIIADRKRSVKKIMLN